MTVLLTPKANSIISRPLTAGSLKPRSASYKRPQVPEESPNKLPEKVQTRTYNKRYRTVSQNEGPKVRYEADRMVMDYQEPEENGNQERGEENKEWLENEGEGVEGGKEEIVEGGEGVENGEDERERMSQTGFTTTSQRKYILELEELLRQEKIRRITLEESLKKALKENN